MTQIRDYAAEYDQHLLTKARQLAGLHDVTQMRRWLAEHDDEDAAGMDASSVYAYILGRLQATTAELVRWVERIPETHRG